MSHASPPRNDRDAEYYEDLLASAAFGTLNSDEAAELREYLAANPGARQILAEMRELASGLPLLIDEVEPSADLRGRIERSIVAPEGARPGFVEDDNGITPLQFPAQPEPTRLHVPHPAWNASLWAAAAALVIALAAGVVLGRYFFADTSDEPTPESIAYEMTLSTPIPDLTAELTYDPDTQIFVLETENMPHAPEGMVYQVWLIDKNNVPQPEGVMDESSFAVTANRDEYAAFAITVEPGPLGSEAPTSQPFFVAPLTPAAES